MQSLAINQINIIPFEAPLVRPFAFAGNTVSVRVGYYLEITAEGMMARGEIAPLPGVSLETLKKAHHDLQEISTYLMSWSFPTEFDDLIKKLRKDKRLSLLCSSVRFGVETAIIELAAMFNHVSVDDFIGATGKEIVSAVLLQGTYEDVMDQASIGVSKGIKVYKLKVGDRNIPLDVKKVQGLREIIGKDGVIRLDANRVWSLSEAVLFAQLVGYAQIEFIEEPIGDPSRLNEFYHDSHMPIALDETMLMLRCGVSAPGRCSPTLAMNEGVVAYVLKPTIVGGVVATLDWIDEARRLGKKAIISSCFETQVGLTMLKALAQVTNEVAGLGTEQWLK